MPPPVFARQQTLLAGLSFSFHPNNALCRVARGFGLGVRFFFFPGFL